MRKYHSVVISNDDHDLIKLASVVLKRHKALGKKSPLNAIDMKEFADLLKDCVSLTEKVEKASKDAYTLNEQKETAFGKAKNQYLDTPGHLLFFLSSIRDILLGTFKGKERELELFGYRVLTTNARSSGNTVGGNLGTRPVPTDDEQEEDSFSDADSDIGIGEEGVNDA